MEYYEVAPLKIVRKDQPFLTYHAETPQPIGSIVLVEVGKKTLVAIVVKKVTQPSYATKSIGALVTPQPLPRALLSLMQWIHEYYRVELATTLSALLPSGITKKRRPQPEITHPQMRSRTKNVLNDAQQQALNHLREKPSGTFILHGVTGSGKTEVYKHYAKHILDQGKSVIVLVPEIALTPQLIDEFAQEFTEQLLVTHSGMSEASRHLVWTEALTSTTPRVVIGPRSALFLPLARIGAIIVDEFHEPSYKQEQSPKYSAIRAATMLGRFHEASVILGSATPPAADYYLASQHSPDAILSLPHPARTDATKTDVQLIDMTKKANRSHHRFLSDALIDAIKATLKEGKQVLIFHNRRGSASITLCDTCGWTALDPKTHTPLTLHNDTFELVSHTTGYRQSVPTSCPVCQASQVIHKGIGTKIIESELTRLFPHATIRRFDGDNETQDTLAQHYGALYDGSVDIIIGTQVVAKGLDLPHLRTVGVVQADAGLALPDYTSSERVFQLLAQVIGRVGRDSQQTQAIIQTYQPEHPAIRFGITQDFLQFYNATLEERRKASFPPYRFLLKTLCIYKTERLAITHAQSFARQIAAAYPDVDILGPAPAFFERINDTYRWHVTFRSTRRETLLRIASHVPANGHWQFDIDPSSLL